jgi:hypothetical protein
VELEAFSEQRRYQFGIRLLWRPHTCWHRAKPKSQNRSRMKLRLRHVSSVATFEIGRTTATASDPLPLARSVGAGAHLAINVVN